MFAILSSLKYVVLLWKPAWPVVGNATNAQTGRSSETLLKCFQVQLLKYSYGIRGISLLFCSFVLLALKVRKQTLLDSS